MKTLAESLFDINKNKSNYTFGDLFVLDGYIISLSLQTYTNTYRDLSKTFNFSKVKRLKKATGSDKNEIIYKTLVQVIQDIELKGDPDDIDKEWLEEQIKNKINDLFISNSYDKHIYIGFINNNALVLTKGYSLFDNAFNTIEIGLGMDLRLFFKRR